ncbi:DUF262 domain-containing protein [Flavobacterium oreochromis]|uniref:DUF262 domain-containing protein n=1 Tax=Flavobacterium oreochromis TaxID=2906078 RepID=A0ABW8P9R9_9FLAO|nr:DUF262 domain-containing protein [Flavobacterium oreochromis]OWP76712.1 hypothetical protein BWG23_07295 [Flavobacterium oreochromis]
MKITEINKKEAEEQLINEKKIVDYDTREFVVEHIIKKFQENEYKIPPYQREFVWNTEKQSRFIESILLDLPIPYIFFADDSTDGKLEIVDGSQRIRTLVSFYENRLSLTGLSKLDKLNNFRFEDLIESRQRRFLRKTLRSIELTEKADFEVKKDIFRRINTDPYDLTDMEIRKGIYEGSDFYKLLTDCSSITLFNEICPISDKRKKRGEAEELILRYFAYKDGYQDFVHRVDVFLDNYIEKQNKKQIDVEKMKQEFINMLTFVKEFFPNGFKKGTSHKSTPRVRFEAISVGVSLAINEKPNLNPANVTNWLDSSDFKKLTTSDGANSRNYVVGRIEYVRNNLLNNGSN